MRRDLETCVATLAGAAMLIATAATPVMAKRFHHRLDPGDGSHYVGPRIGYGYGGYSRRAGYAVPGSGGYGYGYVGESGIPYFYGGPYPYGYYQYPAGFVPTYTNANPYYGYGVGNYGTGLGY